MKIHNAVLIILFWLAMLGAMDYVLGHRVAIFAACFSCLWFVIAFVLLTRPPGIPEFGSHDPTAAGADAWGDEHFIVRRDVIPKVPLAERLRLSVTVACGSCMLIWLTLTLLGR
jgi:hypothetical protein